MIVTCAKCATQFQLDEARVPDSGIRVRCSVCKHAFFVEQADAIGEASSDPVTRAVEEVLHAEGHELPEAIHDLEAAGSRDDDEDWEWSDGGRLSETAASVPGDRFEESFEAAREAVDDLLGSPEPGPPPRPLPAPAAEPGPPEPPAPAALVGLRGEDAPLPLADDPWQVPAWSEGGAEAQLDPEGAPPPAFADADGLGSDADAEPLEAEGGDLDPFADELSGPPELGDLATPDDLDLDEPPGSLDFAQPMDPAPIAAEALPVVLGGRLELAPRRGVPAALARAGGALGWCVVVVLAAGAFWATATPRTAPGAGVGAQALAGLEATGIEGRWVENAIVGPLYVVRGELHNAGREPKAPGARLVLRLLDAEGSPLGAPATSLAPPTPAAWLREAHPRELRGVREAGAHELARTPIAPGARRPFEAVVETLPDAARRFDLGVAPPGASPPEGS